MAKPKFEVRLTPAAEGDYGRIDRQFYKQIRDALDGLETNPRPLKSEALVDSKGLFRLRSGQFRILYEIDYDKSKVVVTRIRHRKEAYK